uniref:ACB domain-containing protein n=1 Tax=Chromera velia CCMP2878 TaxID=1169474 RepID=A0A0G4HTT4_9ALVE|eukprot:Cvel_8495.t1-p1 / transcript=Cvel_8495.t1 / gene=Cvel_8495 / organism=Chromera_velia_CCMP2878 / gene_product=Acyl-CoA-binding domain-containing protein 2, putative / transcript_product=Acyl-CoA-binding domain-containing protein 2, putative / location=Cvel_scaffold469:67415-68377(+) / protein_length=321 / sequence_SO=supercontig / SO=protein_coding / is_pseudo=false
MWFGRRGVLLTVGGFTLGLVVTSVFVYFGWFGALPGGSGGRKKRKMLSGSEDEEFAAAAAYVGRHIADFSQDTQLDFYGLFKQATEGDNTRPQPSMIDLVAVAKWRAWAKFTGMRRTDAREEYKLLLKEQNPEWQETEVTEEEEYDPDAEIEADDPTPKGERGAGAGGGAMGPAVSTMGVLGGGLADPVDEGEESEADRFCRLASEGSIIEIAASLKKRPDLARQKDRDGMTALHWAADRGHEDIVKLLLTCSPDVNCQDQNGDTALHLAVVSGQNHVVSQLLQNGANSSLANGDEETPEDLAETSELRELFRAQRRQGRG